MRHAASPPRREQLTAKQSNGAAAASSREVEPRGGARRPRPRRKIALLSLPRSARLARVGQVAQRAAPHGGAVCRHGRFVNRRRHAPAATLRRAAGARELPHRACGRPAPCEQHPAGGAAQRGGHALRRHASRGSPRRVGRQRRRRRGPGISQRQRPLVAAHGRQARRRPGTARRRQLAVVARQSGGTLLGRPPRTLASSPTASRLSCAWASAAARSRSCRRRGRAPPLRRTAAEQGAREATKRWVARANRRGPGCRRPHGRGAAPAPPLPPGPSSRRDGTQHRTRLLDSLDAVVPRALQGVGPAAAARPALLQLVPRLVVRRLALQHLGLDAQALGAAAQRVRHVARVRVNLLRKQRILAERDARGRARRARRVAQLRRARRVERRSGVELLQSAAAHATTAGAARRARSRHPLRPVLAGGAARRAAAPRRRHRAPRSGARARVAREGSTSPDVTRRCLSRQRSTPAGGARPAPTARRPLQTPRRVRRRANTRRRRVLRVPPPWTLGCKSRSLWRASPKARS